MSPPSLLFNRGEIFHLPTIKRRACLDKIIYTLKTTRKEREREREREREIKRVIEISIFIGQTQSLFIHKH